MMKLRQKKGFSLMELLIAMLLLAIVGSLTLFAFTSSEQINKPGSSVAYNFGRGLIEQFYERVRQDQWGTAGLPLSTVTPGPQGLTKTLNGATYTANYTVNNGAGALDANADGQEDFRKVRMTVTW